MTVKALMPERIGNLVAPLAHKATAMHTTDTAACARLANAVRRRGHSVNGALTKTFRKASS